jgi:hypothetical protein
MKKRQNKNSAAQPTAKTMKRIDRIAKASGMTRRKVVDAALAIVEKTSDKPKGLKLIFCFEASFHDYKNSLLMDAGQQLYFADVFEHGNEVWKAGRRILLADATFDFLEATSVKEAIGWYARCAPFASDSHGDIAPICEMAAKLLPDAETEAGCVRMTVDASANSYGTLVEAGLHHKCSPEEALEMFVNHSDAFVNWANNDFDA